MKKRFGALLWQKGERAGWGEKCRAGLYVTEKKKRYK